MIFVYLLLHPYLCQVAFFTFSRISKDKIYPKKELQNLYVRKIVFILFIFEIQEFDLKNKYILKERQ